MFKWLFHVLIFATSSGKYQNKEKPLKRQRNLGLGDTQRYTNVVATLLRGDNFASTLIHFVLTSCVCWVENPAFKGSNLKYKDKPIAPKKTNFMALESP